LGFDVFLAYDERVGEMSKNGKKSGASQAP